MSKKKQLHSRLDNLFANLVDEKDEIPAGGDKVPEAATDILPADGGAVARQKKATSTAIHSGWSWKCDEEGNYIQCSAEVADFLGLQPEELLGKPLIDFGLSQSSSRKLRKALAETEYPFEIEVEFCAFDGLRLPVRLHILRGPADGTRGNLTGWQGFSQVIGSATQTVSQPGGERTQTRGPIPAPSWPQYPSGSGAPIGYRLENGKVEPVTEILSDAGRRSWRSKSAVVEDAQTNQPAILALAAESLGQVEGSRLLLEFLDDNPERRWSNDELLLVEQVTDQLSLALDNARLFEQTRERSEELSLLREVALQLAEEQQDLEGVLEIISRRAMELLNADGSSVWLWNNEGGYLELLVSHQPDGEAMTGQRVRPGEGLTGKTYLTRRTQVVNDDLESASRDGPFYDAFHASLSTPLIWQNDVVGTLVLTRSTPGYPFLPNEVHLAELLSSQAATVIQNARLFAETEAALNETAQLNEELRVLNEIVKAASQSLELSDTLREVLDQLILSLDFDAGLFTLLDADTERLSLAVHKNLPALIISKLESVGLEGTLCDLVFRRGEVISINDLEHLNPTSFQPLSPESVSGLCHLGLYSYLGVPLESKGQVLGTIGLFGCKPMQIKTSTTRLMRAAGQQVAVALENASLFAQSQDALGETAALYEASAALNAAQSYEDILTTLRQYTWIGRADMSVSLQMFDHPWIGETYPEWSDVLARWSQMPDERLSTRYPFNELPAAQLLIRSNEIVVIEDVYTDPRLDEQTREFFTSQLQCRGAIFLPLSVGGKEIGFTSAIYKNRILVPGSETRRMMALAGQAAVAVENLRLLDESRRKADQLQTAAEIARDTSSTLALDNLLQRTVNLIIERFGFYHASIFLIDEEGKFGVVKASTGEAGMEMMRRGHRLAVGSYSVIGRVMESGTPLVINDVSKDPNHHFNPLLPETKAELGLPLNIGGRITGAMDVQSEETNAFKPDDIAVLQILADQISVAMDNARAYELSQNVLNEMRELDQMKSQFLANMSHELRTPLNSIIGFSRVILKGIDGPVTDLQEQDLTAIYHSGQHLLNLINDVLDLSKIEAGKMELSFEEDVNLTDLINSVMSTAAGLVKDKPVKLVKNIQSKLPLVRADQTKIRQVLINFFSNAAKFTERGTITLNARVQTNPNGREEVYIAVTDTGPGISEEDQDKLFQPFSQVDASLTRKTGGTGLGLSISRHLIEMHGGRIGLDSQTGAGSTFFFILPAPGNETDKVKDLGIQIEVEPLDIPLNDPNPLGPAQGPFSPEVRQETSQTVLEQAVHVEASGFNNPGSDSQAPLILAIDDQPQIIDMYQMYLSSQGYRVIPLTNPAQALDRVRRLKPFAITLDPRLSLPTNANFDGWELLKQLKTDSETRHIPVIICTLLQEQEKAKELGADGYLSKPILAEDLLSVLDGLAPKRS